MGSPARLDRLLLQTSRTFALSIPLLPEPTRREVTVAYLLFRVADTCEDASHWPQEKRLAAFAEFRRLVLGPSPARAARLARSWLADGASAHAGYRALIAQVPFVLDAFLALSPAAIREVRAHLTRSADGMAGFVARSRAGRLTLGSLGELRRYCYAVAGIVGEMLTELFLRGRRELAGCAAELRARAATFGEALQLVNILKDAGADAAEGRRYLPPRVARAAVFALARRDLVVAGEYVQALQEAAAPRGLVEFTALPLHLAGAALDRVEQRGPGAKLSRLEVLRIHRRLRRALDRGGPAVPAPALIRRR